MTPAQRARRMMESLPRIMQLGASTGQIFRAVSTELATMEQGVTRVLRSRWHTLARGFEAEATQSEKGGSELGRIAGLADLHPAASEGAADFRAHLTRFVALHRSGINTVPGVLSLVALAYLAMEPPVITWIGATTAVATFTVRERDGSTRPVRVELVENPPGPAAARFDSVAVGQQIIVENHGLDDATPEVSLTAPVTHALRVPEILERASNINVIFAGVVPAGSTLTLRHEAPPLLDGEPVDAPVFSGKPTRFGSLAVPQARFGSLARVRSRFSVFGRSLVLPVLPRGQSRWVYDTVDKARLSSYLTSEPDPASLIALAASPKDTTPATVRLRWTEIAPATFIVRIPPDYVPPHLRGLDPSRSLALLVEEVTHALSYGRAAGVRARVELALPGELVAPVEGPQTGPGAG